MKSLLTLNDVAWLLSSRQVVNNSGRFSRPTSGSRLIDRFLLIGAERRSFRCSDFNQPVFIYRTDGKGKTRLFVDERARMVDQ